MRAAASTATNDCARQLWRWQRLYKLDTRLDLLRLYSASAQRPASCGGAHGRAHGRTALLWPATAAKVMSCGEIRCDASQGRPRSCGKSCGWCSRRNGLAAVYARSQFWCCKREQHNAQTRCFKHRHGPDHRDHSCSGWLVVLDGGGQHSRGANGSKFNTD